MENVVIIKLGLDMDIHSEIMARANKPLDLGKEGKEQMAILFEEQRKKLEEEAVASKEEVEWEARCIRGAAILADGEMVSLSDLIEAAGISSNDLRKYMIRLRKYISAHGETREVERITRKGEVFYRFKPG